MNRAFDESRDSHCSRCQFEQLNASYYLNTLENEYAESAEKAYNAGLKRKARIHSQAKKPLYSLKRVILGEFIQNDCVENIRTHKINGHTYYCVSVGEFSFHIPPSNGISHHKMGLNPPQNWTHLTPIQVTAPMICVSERH